MECPPGLDDEKDEKPNQSDDYLKALQDCEHHAIDQFDKYILALVSGAIGTSFAFLKDVVKVEVVRQKGWLIGAWIAWGITLTCSLSAFYVSHLAMRYAQEKYRKGVRRYDALAGRYGKAVAIMNPTMGICFILGLVAMMVFVTINISNDGRSASGPTTNVTTALTVTPASNSSMTILTNTVNAVTTSVPTVISTNYTNHQIKAP
jgi:hypothetical protein